MYPQNRMDLAGDGGIWCSTFLWKEGVCSGLLPTSLIGGCFPFGYICVCVYVYALKRAWHYMTLSYFKNRTYFLKDEKNV